MIETSIGNSGALTVMDTFPRFLSFWDEIRGISLDAQIDAWEEWCGSKWPELLQKQQESYAGEGFDWREFARERVFPHLGERLPAMSIAHDNVLRCSEPVYNLAQERLSMDTDLTLVIYVGIGCGAGWGTTYAGAPAVLLGLEMIAECGWEASDSLEGLLAHEIGHVAHKLWRDKAQMEAGSGPWWQLYEEGFAQRSEHMILARDTWHECKGLNGPDWLDWCQRNRARLASEFMCIADAGESVRPFFGSWYDIEGRIQCGYFLGHEVIRELEENLHIREIALMADYESRCRAILERLTSRVKPEGSDG
jgi:hypothetical protein